jgi:hypothetical protein
MKNVIRVAGVLAVVGALSSFAVANAPGPIPTPSSRLSIEMDVVPVKGQPGRFLVSSTILDLERNEVVGKPRLVIGSDKPARIETGADGKWMLQISVAADGGSRKAAYEATFTREGITVSKQRLTVDLNG